MKSKRSVGTSAVVALAALCASLALRSTAAAGGNGPALPPCVPDGECRDYCVCRPPLGLPGDPAGAEWVGGTGMPRAWEVDPFSNDDLGALNGGDPACIEICNLGGELVTPQGEVVNPPGEGDCAELKYCWTYRYVETIGSSAGIGGNATAGAPTPFGAAGGGVGGTLTTTRSHAVLRTGKKCSGAFEVCPC